MSDFSRDTAPIDGPWIIATPNPVVAGRGGGKTMLTWDTTEGFAGQVYVSLDHQPAKLLPASDRYWVETSVQKGHAYEFLLFGRSPTAPLATVKVICK